MHSSSGARLAGGVTAAAKGIPAGVIKQLPPAIGTGDRGPILATMHQVSKDDGALVITCHIPGHNCRPSCFHLESLDPMRPGCSEYRPKEHNDKLKNKMFFAIILVQSWPNLYLGLHWCRLVIYETKKN